MATRSIGNLSAWAQICVSTVLLPWPIPEVIVPGNNAIPPVTGAYAWPVWYPLPAWLPERFR